MTPEQDLPASDPAPDLDERLRFEALDRLYHLADESRLVTTALVPLMMVMVMWSEVGHGLLVSWALAFLIVIGVHRALVTAYLRQTAPARQARAWGRRLTGVHGCFGLLWTSAVFLFFVPGSVAHQFFLFSFANILSLSAVFRAMYWLPSVYVYSLPIMAAILLRLALEETFVYWVLALMLLGGIVWLVQFAGVLNRTLHSEMALRYRSADLAATLEAKTEEAERAMLAKSRFLAAASHDLRQPLHALTLFVDALKASDREEERARILARIEHSLDALKKLFDGLLDVSRLDANVVAVEERHFDLAELVGHVVEGYRAVAEGKNLKLLLHTRPTIVVSDRVLLERVIGNLVANAIRYTDAGGVLVSTRLRGDTVLLQVWDTGIGIPDRHQDEVFHEFVQLHNPNRDRSQGLGLGLAIVQRLCRLLRIPIELRSRPGRGSVFSLRLARGHAAPSEVPGATPRPRGWDLSGHRVLVIDDERDILEAMQVLLGNWGLEVVTGQNQAIVLEELERLGAAPELMLVDLRLADSMSGIDVMNEIRARYGGAIPGIVITGDTGPDQINLARSSGYAVLHKPVSPPRLRAMVQQHLTTPGAAES